MMAIENATWGQIKYIFFGDIITDPTSISLSLAYPSGADAWNPVAPPDPTRYPGEVWYEKTAEYALTVQAGDRTWINAVPLTAYFVVRSAEVGDHTIWQLVTWRDDI
jgi:hypothetical protein